jgi:hypothetical protein
MDSSLHQHLKIRFVVKGGTIIPRLNGDETIGQVKMVYSTSRSHPNGDNGKTMGTGGSMRIPTSRDSGPDVPMSNKNARIPRPQFSKEVLEFPKRAEVSCRPPGIPPNCLALAARVSVRAKVGRELHGNVVILCSSSTARC